MRGKHILFSVWIISILIYLIVTCRQLNQGGYAHLRELAQTLSLEIALGLLVFILWSHLSPKIHSAISPKWWFYGFTIPLATSLMIVTLVNPYGRFPWGRSDVYVNTAARTIKMHLYQALPEAPGIVIIGSSRAFNVPSSYVQEKFGFPAFNMGTNSGNSVDILTLTRWMIAQKNPALRIIIAEISVPFYTDKWETDMPLEALPYVPSGSQAAILESMAEQSISIPGLFDAAYTVWTIDTGRATPPVYVFSTDGSSDSRQFLENSYKTDVKMQIPLFINRFKCKRISSKGEEYVQELAELGQKEGFAIVFYHSPVNAVLFDTLGLDNRGYLACMSKMDSFMEDLMRKYPNVFFKNLTYYPPISEMREDGYFDLAHLNTQASKLVIDALISDIEDAMKWSRQEALKISP